MRVASLSSASGRTVLAFITSIPMRRKQQSPRASPLVL